MQAYIESQATNIYYQVEGQGPPIVLIHAGIADHRMWDAQIPALSEHYQVMRYDVRGFGKSNNPAGEYNDHLDLLALLDELKVDRAAIVGASNGGRIALDFALAFPSRLSSLVLIGASVSGHQVADEIVQGWGPIDAAFDAGDLEAAAEATMQMWLAGPHRSLDAISSDIQAHVKQMLLDTYALPEEMDEGDSLPLEPLAFTRLEDIAAPTLVLVGEKDFDDKVALSRILVQRIPQAQLELIPDTAHLPNMEKPVEFTRILERFLVAG
ncbi:MAG: alpha/beta fold hydrolase [Chloroflexi bacterium]|nr:MAG: alpha/beta fold hydrolase [Chloroflexota bacterium]MBL1193229.1 alpha/beta fold hydrolase [Chloroflexota bacterium]NOH10524.1 alpha/beta fold hydrolase [Chloroflexota bacterium]